MVGGVFSQVLGLTTIFTPWLLLAIFLIALTSEFGIMIPFLMESVWLFSGYNVAIGIISPGYLVLFCLAGLIGRQAGSSALFHISWFSSTPLGIFYRKNIEPRLSERLNRSTSFQKIFYLVKIILRRLNLHPSRSALSKVGNTDSIRLLGKKFRISPFTVALGRFFWLRLPITIAMGATGQRASLLWGVAIFSLVWDGAYIVIGMLGGRGGLEPVQMLLYPLGAMVFISALVFGYKKLNTSIARNHIIGH